MKPARLSIALLYLVLVEVVGQEKISHCGQLQQDHMTLMTNSQPTHHWPWHTAIFHVGNEREITYQCGGTVISSNTILTAAHCVYKSDRPMKHNQIAVSLGRLNLSDVNETSSQWPTVARIIPHPGYNSLEYSNDIAMIKLSTDLKFNEFVKPICLWSAGKTDFSEIEDRDGIVVGWGRTEAGEVLNELRQVSLPVISPAECFENNREFFGQHLSPSNFCAGFRNGTNACVGDNGGSMTFEDGGIYYIRGILSVAPIKANRTASYATCDSTEYLIFTDVARYLPWIEGSYCEEKVRCEWRYRTQCHIYLTNSQRQCKIVFNKMSSTTIPELHIDGDLDTLPDISDAATKLINLRRLHLGSLKLKVVDRARLTPFSKIDFLRLSYNEISQLAPDTLDDFTDLTRLELDNNKFKELHDDTFNELHNLQVLWLNDNQLETLPANIFHNNQKLETITLNNNKLKELYVDTFNGLHNLQLLWLHDNQLETLPANIFHSNPKLEWIYLSGNKLNKLHADTFKELPSLQYPLRVEYVCSGHCRVVV